MATAGTRALLARLLGFMVIISFLYPVVFVKNIAIEYKAKGIPPVSNERGSRARRSVSIQHDIAVMPSSFPNCVKSSIDDFPSDFMSQYQRLYQGGIIFHILLSLYMFAALAVVCDQYFVPALEQISESLNLHPDVAGATFMAAGSSAPEFFTSVIGVFITKGDIGLGTIVGSAVFNILFIVSVCGIFAGCVLTLNWWPLSRDCLYYLLSVAALVSVTYDQKVYWYEAMCLVIMYLIYIIIMYFNNNLERFFVRCLNKSEFLPSPESEADSDETKVFISDEEESDSQDDSETQKTDKETEVVSFDDSPFSMPSGFIAGVLWIVNWPTMIILYFTIPDCRKDRWKRFYMLTFLLATVWIGGLSYILVWMVTIIGYTFGIPDVIMGLTFLAAGSSVPDCLSSVLVARRGQGDMAVSNSIGSNIFDILLCLGLPWLLRTTIVDNGTPVIIISGSIIYTSLSLLGTVMALILLVVLNGWKLDKCLGLFFMILYVGFISVATLFELNIFGKFSFPICGK